METLIFQNPHPYGMWDMPVTRQPFEWVKERREDRNLRQVDVEKKSIEIDPALKISQSHLSKIEKGHSPLAGLGARKLDVLRRILNVSPEVWVKQTGLELVTTYVARELGEVAEPEIDAALAEAVKLYGDMPEFAGIKSHNLQRALNDIDFRRRPTTPADWLAKYLKFKDELPNGDN